MSTSERIRHRRRACWQLLVSAFVGIVGIATIVNCGPSEACLRQSDCSEGFTCTAGECRSTTEPLALDATSEAGEGGAATDAKKDVGTSSKDAATEATDAEETTDEAATDEETTDAAAE